jgi:sec-independent protein translocase protein TatC
MGIVSPETLAKNRKYAIVLAFVIAAFLTPTPDAFNQSLMALPMIVLYEAGIWASKILNTKKKEMSGETKEQR